MVTDARVCLGCGKEVPNYLRDRLMRLGWTFIEIKDEDDSTYYSNCGCMSHDDFAILVKEKESEE